MHRMINLTEAILLCDNTSVYIFFMSDTTIVY